MTGDFRIGSWLVQPRLNSISSAGESRRVEPKVMQVLVYLAERAGEVVSKEDLIAGVWAETFVSDDVLLRSISELRRVLDDDAKDPRFIRTITKRGYRLIAEVRSAEEASAPAHPPPRPKSRRLLVVAGGLVVLAGVFAAGYLGWWLRQPRAPSRSQTMLVVLPFRNSSGDAGEEYFSDGVTGELITQLAEMEPVRLGVIGYGTAMQYRETGQRIGQVGRELDVDYVLQGTAQRQGGRVRISAQLMKVAGQVPLWAQSFERDMGGILTVYREVAQAVGGHVGVSPASPQAPAAARSVKPEAYVAYLLGDYSRSHTGPEHAETAVQHYQRSVTLDPDFAPAWLGLAYAYRRLGSWWSDVPPKKVLPLARKAAHRALELDPALGEAHTLLGAVCFVYDWNWREAEVELRRGIELSPNASGAHGNYGDFLRAMGRFKEAHLELDRCLEMDPFSTCVAGAAVAHLEAGEPEEAERLFVRLANMRRDTPQRVWGLATYYSAAGKLEQAIQVLEEAMRVPRPDRINMLGLGQAYARAGRSAQTRQILELLLKTPDVSQATIGNLYLNLLDNEQAIQWYQKAFEARDPTMVWLRRTPPGNPIWKDPRFQDLIRRMNYP